MAPGKSERPGISAFDWDAYKSRKSALQYLRANRVLVDTILESEDGSSRELIHSQIVSAFSDKLAKYIEENGQLISGDEAAKLLSSRADEIKTQDKSLLRSPQAATNNSNSNNNNPKQQTLEPQRQAQQIQTSANKEQPVVASSLWSARCSNRLKLVPLAKVNKYTLRILTECAYTGYIRADLHSGGIWQVLEMAQHYEMAEVIRACCNFLLSNLQRDNCIKFYHIGLRHHDPLMRAAWHKIRANLKHILAKNLTGLDGAQLPVWANAAQSTSASGGQQQVADTACRLRVALEESLASLKFEHFETLMNHDKLNVDNEESVWLAIKLWCLNNPLERPERMAKLLCCLRFPRFKSGTDFSAKHIWRDPLVCSNKFAQQQLAILDRNHRDFLANLSARSITFDGHGLPCAMAPRQLRPRVPQSILLAIGGWQQGQPTRLIESYDLNCNLWFQCKRRIMAPLAYHGIEYVKGLLYICGGTDGREILNEVFAFDPVRGDCLQKPSMRELRCYVSTACLQERYLFAIGGHNGSQRMKSVERLCLDEEVWSHVHDMNVARSDASACVHKSLIYIAGGLNDQVIESSCEFYNPTDDTWTFITSMIVPRTSFTMLLYRDSLLAIGGNNGTARLASVEQYNFQTNQWSPHSLMKHRRSTFSAALLEDDKLIVVGGYNGQTPFNQVEMYNEAGRTWQPIQKIHFDRSGLKVVALSDLPNALDYTFHGLAQGAGGGGGGQTSAADSSSSSGATPMAAASSSAEQHQQPDNPLAALRRHHHHQPPA